MWRSVQEHWNLIRFYRKDPDISWFGSYAGLALLFHRLTQKWHWKRTAFGTWEGFVAELRLDVGGFGTNDELVGFISMMLISCPWKDERNPSRFWPFEREEGGCVGREVRLAGLWRTLPITGFFFVFCPTVVFFIVLFVHTTSIVD